MADADDRDGDAPRARSFWSGTITFGLVSIPVELYPANRSLGVSLRMVSEDGVPLARRYFCPEEKKELDRDDIVRGYEVDDGEFVVVTDEELERLAPEKTRDIDLRRFVDAAEIDPIFFERAYYLTPGGNSTKAYRLLAETMEETNRAGIATFVMRGKEYLVAILAEKGIMRAETLRFAADVRAPEDVDLPAPAKPRAATVKSIEAEIAKRVEKKLDEDELADRAAERLLKLVAKKEKAGRDVIEGGAGSVEPTGDVIDLMEVLKRSLQGAGGATGTTKKAAKKPKAAKQATKTKKAAKKASGKAAKSKRSAKKTANRRTA